MAKFGSTGDAGKRKFGSEAGRQRIQERRERLAEIRGAPGQQVPAENVNSETDESESRSASKRSKKRR